MGQTLERSRVARQARPAAAFVCIALVSAGAALAQSAAYQEALRASIAAPGDPEAAFRFASIAAEEGDFNAAITALERVLAIAPGLDNIRLELGVLYLQTGATEIGEQYIREALESPDVPPEVRARAEEYLVAAETANEPLAVAGYVTTGLIAETNANSAPTGLDIPFFEPDPDTLGQDDVSAFLDAGISLRYDLGLQAGHVLALDANAYRQVYSELGQLNLGSIAVSAGADLNLSRPLGRAAELALRLDASSTWRDGERYVTEVGPSARLGFAIGERTLAEVSTFWRRQDFHPTGTVGANNNRDGAIYGIGFGAEHALNERTRLTGSLSFARKDAEERFEAYDRAALSVGVARAFESPVAAIAEHGPWVGRLGASYALTDYAGPDEFIDPTQSRRDRTGTLSAGLSVPVASRAVFEAEIGRTVQDSSYVTDAFDNTYGSFSLTIAF